MGAQLSIALSDVDDIIYHGVAQKKSNQNEKCARDLSRAVRRGSEGSHAKACVN
jgi:plasmid stabilization system protein ParE